MVDSVSKTVRSRIMSRIKGRDTGPEIILRKALSSEVKVEKTLKKS